MYTEETKIRIDIYKESLGQKDPATDEMRSGEMQVIKMVQPKGSGLKLQPVSRMRRHEYQTKAIQELRPLKLWVLRNWSSFP